MVKMLFLRPLLIVMACFLIGYWLMDVFKGTHAVKLINVIMKVILALCISTPAIYLMICHLKTNKTNSSLREIRNERFSHPHQLFKRSEGIIKIEKRKTLSVHNTSYYFLGYDKYVYLLVEYNYFCNDSLCSNIETACNLYNANKEKLPIIYEQCDISIGHDSIIEAADTVLVFDKPVWSWRNPIIQKNGIMETEENIVFFVEDYFSVVEDSLTLFFADVNHDYGFMLYGLTFYENKDGSWQFVSRSCQNSTTPNIDLFEIDTISVLEKKTCFHFDLTNAIITGNK